MHCWKVEKPNRLSTEVKKKFNGKFTDREVRWAIEHNRCFVNHQIERYGSAQLRMGDLVSIHLEKISPLCIDQARILYEDGSLFIYNKPPFFPTEKLAEISHYSLVHRLDRDTTGVIVLAKNEETRRQLERQFRERLIHKTYYALVNGLPGKQGIIIGKMAPLHKREGATIWGMDSKGIWSKTEWKTIKQDKNTALLQCIPITGRTHQIRVHLKHLGHPIIGDFTYGSKKEIKGVFRPLLHAASLSFKHPQSDLPVTYSAPLPSDFFLSI